MSFECYGQKCFTWHKNPKDFGTIWFEWQLWILITSLTQMQFSKTKFKGRSRIQTFPFHDFCSGLTLNVPFFFFFFSALDKHKFYVYETRLFYVTRGSMFLMFRSIYNPPRSLRTSPLHYFPRRVLSRKILRGRFVSYYRTKSSASRGAQHQRAGLLF